MKKISRTEKEVRRIQEYHENLLLKQARAYVAKLKNPTPQSKTVLEEAIEITSGDRQRDYNHPKPNHEKIAVMWNAYLSIRKDPQAPISASDVAFCMILLKIVRHAHTPKRDNLVDIPGYARCVARIDGFEP